jgi:hypothetical protein
MKRIIFIALVFSSVFSSCKKEISRENEPNDRFDHANLLEVDRPVRGLLSTSTDRDIFVVDIAEPGSFDASVSAVRGVNIAFRIYRNEAPNPLLLKVVDDARKSSPERMRNIWMDRGRYYIMITHGDRDEPKGDTESYYELKLALNSRIAGEEREPNDSPEQATVIKNGDASGYLSPSFSRNEKGESTPEYDWYSLSIDASKEAPKILNASVSGISGITESIELFDGEKNMIAAGKSSAPGEPASIDGRGILKGGTYYLRISSVNFESDPDKMYTLKTEIKDFDKSFELEPNDSIETSYEISDNTVKGSIFPDSDRDFFRVKVTEPSFVSAYAEFSESVDGTLAVYDSDGRKMFESNSFPAGRKEIISPIFAKSDIFLEVSGKVKNGNKDATYSLFTAKEAPEDGLEIEPNDTKSAAQKISGKIKGYLHYKKDKDFYLLESDGRATKTFKITGIANAVFSVSLTDSHGYIIRTERVSNEKGISFRDMIDGKAYLIIESEREVQGEPYTVTIGDKIK